MEFILSLIYLFKETISSNLDLFYIFGGILILIDMFCGWRIILQTRKYVLPLLIYALLQLIIIDNMITIRFLVNIVKIIICIFLFYYTKIYIYKININKTVFYSSLLFTLMLPVSIFFSESHLLWRLNDIVNDFHKIRLKYFYFEPSELSFQVCFVLIFILYYILNRNNRQIYILFGLILSYVVLLSAGLGGMVSVFLAIIVMLLIYVFKSLNLRKLTILFFVLFASALALAFMIYYNSSILLRFYNIINGTDSSFVYRFYIGKSVMTNALINTKGIGVGFGNLNTNSIQNFYSVYGLKEVISNSFMYFIAEGGMFSVIFLFVFHISIFKSILKNKSTMILSLPLFIYVFSYQIAGGYFTNPLNWIIYGIAVGVETKKS